MHKWKLVLNCLLAAVCAVSGGVAVAQNFPAKVIRIVVPFPPGGPTDLYARVIGQKLQEAWGQSVIVDNRPGGTGLVGSDLVRQAAADGYTLLFTSNSAHVMGPLLREPRSFDPVRDFTPISMVIRYPMYILVNAGVPARSLARRVDCARQGAPRATQLFQRWHRQRRASRVRAPERRRRYSDRARSLQGSGAGADRVSRR